MNSKTDSDATQAAAVTDASIPLIAEGLKLADFAGMHPRADLVEKLGHVDSFIQYKPHDGGPPTGDTEVWMAHTASHLYFAFICHDPEVQAISSHLARRENLFNEDRVTILLDPFRSKREGILLEINPTGVQADAIWTEGGGPPDFSYDLVWDTESRVEADGWMTLVSIPFRSLRFPRDSADWGIVFQRHMPRTSETSMWPRVTPNVSGLLTQEAQLHNLTGMSHSHGLQFNPYVIAQNQRSLIQTDKSYPYFTRRDLAGSGGGEFKAILDDTLVIDATVNPDFSTVESDQPQFQTNQRYQVFFPELRPFFLENSNFFQTPINLVYTRNIVHPEYGARMTGKVGNTNLGLLTIDDRLPGEQVSPGDALYGKRALVAVARISQNIHAKSRVGALFATREFGEGWNRVGGLDFTASLDSHWSLMGQTVLSSTHKDKDSTDADTYTAGHATKIDLIRSGRSFNMEAHLKNYTADFESQLGFVPTTDMRHGEGRVGYQWFPKSSWINSYGADSNQSIAWDQRGHRLWHTSNFAPYVMLPRSTRLLFFIGQNSDTLSPDDDNHLPQEKNFTENFIGFHAIGAPSTTFNYDVKLVRGGNVNYHPAIGKPSILMDQQQLTLMATYRPISQLTIDNTVLIDRDFAVQSKNFVFESQTYRTKINYQFTRALSARVIAEYDSTLANPLESALARKKQISTQALFTWLPHPGTAIYLGYNNNLQNIDRSLCYRLSSGICDKDADDLPRSPNWLNDGRQFFMKFSYLYRF